VTHQFQQEWLAGNEPVAFPFVSGCSLPSAFLLDLRFFPTGTDILDAYISTIQYNSTTDSYTIVFASAADNTSLLAGTISRLPADGGSRVGLKQVIASGSQVCLFTPGKDWDDPSWGGAGDWTSNLNYGDSAISPDLINPGPSTFKGIFIDGDVPDESEWGNGATQHLFAGYNITFKASARSPQSQDDTISLSAIGGAGDGYWPTKKAVIDYVAVIGGARPDSKGNINMEGIDCLRVFQPRTGNDPVPATMQLNSDCLPCCSCGSYRKFSRSIGRRSAKLKDLCDALNQKLEDSVSAYNDAVAIINANRRPLVAIRNVRALASRLTFTSQNLCSVPVFAYTQLRVVSSLYGLGPASVTEGHTRVVPTSTYLDNPATTVEADRLLLPGLPFCVAERPLAGIPTVHFDITKPLLLLCLGQPATDGSMLPLAPGEVVQHTIHFPDRAAAVEISSGVAGSLAAALPEFQFQTVAVYGASHGYACSAEQYQAKVVESTAIPDEFETCDLPFASSFDTIRTQ
jgi:hypothetical protein